MFELYKDGVFLGERPKSEVEQIAQSNEKFGYRRLIYDDGINTGIAILEKDSKRLETFERYIKDFNKTINRAILEEKLTQHDVEQFRKALLILISNISEPTKRKKKR
jgi:hypothetical protein